MPFRLTLQAGNVAYQTPTGPKFVLQDIDFHIEQGEWVTFIGPNGSGKSSLALVLAGQLPLSSGQRTLTSDAVDDVRVQIVFQNPDVQIVGQTVWEDVCFAPRQQALPTDEIDLRARQALAMTHLTALAQWPVTRLSGGERQRLALAGAMAARPDVLILDEVTSMLDAAMRRQIWNTVREIQETGVAVVWLTQWLEEVSASPRVVVMADARIVTDGTAEAFFSARTAHGTTIAEQLGYTLPFAAQVANELRRLGLPVPHGAITMDQVIAEVTKR